MLAIGTSIVLRVLSCGANQNSLNLFCGVVMTTRRHLLDTRFDACSSHLGDKTWFDALKSLPIFFLRMSMRQAPGFLAATFRVAARAP